MSFALRAIREGANADSIDLPTRFDETRRIRSLNRAKTHDPLTSGNALLLGSPLPALVVIREPR